MVLAPAVHAVIADERAVFLDVTHDRYFKLGVAQTRLLVSGGGAARDRLVAELIRKGLARDADGAPARSEAKLRVSPVRRRASTVVGVIGACRWAANTLRRRRFSDIVQWARAARPADAIADLPSVSRFLARRPFYPRDYNCLFDSLALTRFLRLRGLAGDWVFGVRGAPFAAHCWVEVNGEPVNDEVGFVAPYQPILVL